MSALGQVADKVGVFGGYLDEGDTYPYDLTDDHVISISVVNSGSVDMIATLTYRDTVKGTDQLKVPAGYSLSGVVHELGSINVTAGDAYTIALFNRSTV